MTDFAYTARDAQGQKITGMIAASTQREAVSLLSGRALFPIDISTDKSASSKLTFRRRISGQLLSTTFGQLASLLRCGVPMLRSLAVLTGTMT